MRQLTILTSVLLFFSLTAYSADKTFHSFKVQDIDGNEKALSDYKGKVVLVLNVASKCGLTKQYEGLQKLYLKYKTKGFEIVAFPANNFNKQEPGSNKEIKQFCKERYEVTFDMMAKIDVKGAAKHELYKHLIAETKGAEISWNFEKFLIGPDGKVISRFKPRTKPEDKKLVKAVEDALSKL